MLTIFFISCLVFLVAALYGSVGHAGASGYLALLTLIGWAPPEARSLALVLNLFVSAVVTIRFFKAGYFRGSLFFPLAAVAFPCSLLGVGAIKSTHTLAAIIGVVLIFSAYWLLTGKREPDHIVPAPLISKISLGAVVGFLAGVSGTGGGIFLSPALIYLRWGKLKEISATAAPFIFVNSLGGISGLYLAGHEIRVEWLVPAIFAAVGGYLGSTIGVRIFDLKMLQILLAVVLLIAGLKLLLI